MISKIRLSPQIVLERTLLVENVLGDGRCPVGAAAPAAASAHAHPTTLMAPTISICLMSGVTLNLQLRSFGSVTVKPCRVHRVRTTRLYSFATHYSLVTADTYYPRYLLTYYMHPACNPMLTYSSNLTYRLQGCSPHKQPLSHTGLEPLTHKLVLIVSYMALLTLFLTTLAPACNPMHPACNPMHPACNKTLLTPCTLLTSHY